MEALRKRWIEEVCALRDEGWTYLRLAELTGVSPPTLSMWVSDHTHDPALVSGTADWLARRHRRREAACARAMRLHPPDEEGEAIIRELSYWAGRNASKQRRDRRAATPA